MMLVAVGGLLVGLVCLDMGIKQYVEDNFKMNEERETILDKVVFRRVHNKGFCLNILDKRTDIVKLCSGITAIGVVLYDIRMFVVKGQWIKKLGMVFLTAGAFSNTYDRWIRGKVIDYIGIQFKNKKLEKITANLADVYVLIGAVLTSLRPRG